MPLPNGTYLVFGPMHAPEVHIVSKSDQESYWERLRMADGMQDKEAAVRFAMKAAFKAPDATYALPAWSIECMQTIATEYQGPHMIAVRGIAAAIALGRPFGQDARDKGGKDQDGGERVEPKPKAPKPSSPAKLSAFDQLKQGA